MPTDRYAVRRQKLLQQLRKSGVESMLVSNYTNVTYLTGFSGDSSFLLIGPKILLLISDSRYTTQLSDECPALDVHIRTNKQPIVGEVGKVAKKAKLKQLGFESISTSYQQWEQLQKDVQSVELQPLPGMIEELRMIKDASEVAETREAVRQAEQGFAMLRSSLIGEMTELEAAHDLEHAMRRFGAKAAAFEPIVAVGPRAALPHAHPTEQLISASGFVLIDWGAQTHAGYKSDLTRILVTGKFPPKLRKIYGVVLKAQRAAIKKIRPGVASCDVDAAARGVIEAAGFGKNFGHGLGHGVGLDIHEGPRMSPVEKMTLKPGMIVTVEPGIYLPGWGGVRIEDDVLVTRDGHEVLTSVPKEFEEAVL